MTPTTTPLFRRILTNPRWEILVGLLLILAGLGLAYTAYDHGLPFIDYPDEMTMWTRGRATIDPNWDMFQPEYPPGMVWLSAVVQTIQQNRGEAYINPAGATQAGRLTSVLAFALTLALIMRLTHDLLTDAVGRALRLLAMLMAGLAWMWLPLAVLHARFAMPDSWLCLWFVASLVAATRAWKTTSERWLWLSVLCGILATLFKWQAGIVFAAPAIAGLRFWSQRRHFIRMAVLFIIIVGAFSIWVIFVRHALQGGLYMPGTTPAVPTPLTILDNLIYQATAIGSPLILGLWPLLGVILLLLSKRARTGGETVPILILMLVILALDTVLSINGSRLFPRHYLPVLALLGVLAGVSFALVINWLNSLPLAWIGRAAFIAISLLTVALPLWGQLADTLALTREQSLPDRRVMLMDWARENAQTDPIMVTDVNLAAALDPLYGYSGPKVAKAEWGVYTKSDSVTDAVLKEQGIRYLVAPHYITFDQLKTPLTPILTNGDDSALRGETWRVYYVGAVAGLYQPANDITFGDTIQLRGFAVEPSEVCAGQSITVHTAWGALKPPQRYYAYFLHLAGADGELSTPINGQQPVGDHRPTISWTRPDELLVSAPVEAAIGADVKPGTYELWLGVFEPEGTDRLYLPDGKHYGVVGQLQVKACPAS